MTRWTRKRAFDDDDDWIVLRDGLVVGRVFYDNLEMANQGSTKWRWSVVTIPIQEGAAPTLEAALERVRELATNEWG